jgi:hypothetical protein
MKFFILLYIIISFVKGQGKPQGIYIIKNILLKKNL